MQFFMSGRKLSITGVPVVTDDKFGCGKLAIPLDEEAIAGFLRWIQSLPLV